MALYSPAYINSFVGNTSQSQINYDSNKNFNLFNQYYVGTYVANSTPSASGFKSHIRTYNYSFFASNYKITFDYIHVSVESLLAIKRNSIISYVPVNPISMINHHDFYFGIALSDRNLADLNSSSNTQTLRQNFQANNTLINSFLQYTLFQSLPSPTNTFSYLNTNLATLKFEIPLSYERAQFNRGIYIYFIVGIGQPNYGINLSYAGNGLLDLEFTREIYTAVLPANYFFDSGSSNYGSNYVQTSNPTGAASAKIVNWYYTINCQLYGKILS